MRKNKIFSLFFVGLALFVCIFLNINCVKAKSQRNMNIKLTSRDELRMEDFQIEGIQLGKSIPEAEKKFGKPKKTTHDKESNWTTYEFDEMMVDFHAKTKRIMGITVKKGDFYTYRGVRISSDEKDVLFHYGETEKYENKYLIYSKVFQPNDLGWEYAIEFTVIDKKVKGIKFYFAAN